MAQDNIDTVSEKLASAPLGTDTGSTSTIMSSESAGGKTCDEKPDHGWPLKHKVDALKDRDVRSGFKARELGVTWNNLNVDVISADSAVNENMVSQFNIPKKISESRHKKPLRRILSDSHGCVKPGEMLLVLGRPGSGCTTLLNMIANRRRGYASVSGDVWYGSMTPKEAEGYRGQIAMNTEEELFFPTLTVSQTMDFATRLKIPHHVPNDVDSAEALRLETKEFLLESVGISHTSDTMVGNEFVRGVSGGERKRVSIIETLATRGSVYCWDNSTRGLDASTALSYTKAIRAMTDVLGLASIVTLYQAGNGIYDLFDKVLVLDEGQEIYYGPIKDAQPYMESLGFICRGGSNVADYLTGVSVPTERLIQEGYEHVFPRNTDMLLEEYKKSEIYPKMTAEYDFPTTQETQERTQTFREAVAHDKNPGLPKSSPLTASLQTQMKASIIRQYEILWGDKSTFIIKQASTIIQALIAGSLFYNAPDNTEGLFVKSGALFFSMLYPSLVAMSEVTDSFTGRPVLIKHKAFAFYHPAAFCVAQIAADIPILLVQTSTFGLIVYFMVGLTASAGAFFTYWILLFVTAMVSPASLLHNSFISSF
jgi:ABC-type multidrug transport system ATPase subunit